MTDVGLNQLWRDRFNAKPVDQLMSVPLGDLIVAVDVPAAVGREVWPRVPLRIPIWSNNGRWLMFVEPGPVHDLTVNHARAFDTRLYDAGSLRLPWPSLGMGWLDSRVKQQLPTLGDVLGLVASSRPESIR